MIKNKLHRYTYNFAKVLQHTIFKCSYNRTLDHSGMSHDATERYAVEMLERATDNL